MPCVLATGYGRSFIVFYGVMIAMSEVKSLLLLLMWSILCTGCLASSGLHPNHTKPCLGCGEWGVPWAALMHHVPGDMSQLSLSFPPGL